ncbi:subtilisin-like protease SBT5.3 [Panicum miliaceum]|uniref:Subtilisin-like protease SBT5.3 n=1 Tax=Panicum miliaceum TaxID=4540 RepID=A0A3L6PDZ7_PANMI|nr:subtilisin-like protease SBT5.3 [Panicum miliaceum]
MNQSSQSIPVNPRNHRARVLTVFLAAECSFRILYEFRAIRALSLQIDGGVLTLLERLPGVLKVIPGSLLRLRTTHSWEFLGLAGSGRETAAWSSAAKLGEGTIIGNIDTTSLEASKGVSISRHHKRDN